MNTEKFPGNLEKWIQKITEVRSIPTTSIRISLFLSELSQITS